MGFVNHRGEPIDLKKLQTPKRGKTARVAEASHKGYRVVGLSPAQVQAARQENAAMNETRRKQGAAPVPFELDAWARNAKPQKVNPKPCATTAGAEEFKAPAERQGWIKVTIEEIAKGGS